MIAIPLDRTDAMRRLQGRALAVGVAASVLCAVAAWFNPSQFCRAYLAAYLFFLSISHGCLAVLMVYHLTGGAWGYLIRNILEAGMRTLPLLAVLFVPIALGMGYLFLWADPQGHEVSEQWRHREAYLNVPFFIGRAIGCFALWLAVVYFLSAGSRAQERTGNPAIARRLTKLSGPGLVIYGVTIFFASIDWLMSLIPDSRSTIIAPLFASGEVLVGFACALLFMAWLVARPPVNEAVSVEAVNDLGSLLFTFVIIWAYMAFFQFMLVWIANLPYDVAYYTARDSAGWKVVAWLLFVLHFAVPFFLLLVRSIKRNPRWLAGLAGLILLMHLVFIFFEVLPAFPPGALIDYWPCLVTPFAVGGLWWAFFLWNLGRQPLLPNHDANREAAVHFHLLDLEQQARCAEVGHG
jgi:hypothetical protein